MNPAPAERCASVTVNVQSFGAPRSFGLSVSDACVLAMHTGRWLNLTLEIAHRTGAELSADALGRIDTVRDLLHEVAEASDRGGIALPADPLEAPEELLSEQQKKWLEPLGSVQSVMASGFFSLNRFLMRCLFRVQTRGLENLPAQGPYVLAPNHTSYLDPFALAAVLSNRQLRETHWAGWTGVAFRNAVLRFFSRLAQTVPIDQERAALSSLAFGAVVLKHRNNLVWFPEGERSPTGELEPFKLGLGILLEHLPVPVLPVFIHGGHEALPVGKILPRFRQMTAVCRAPRRCRRWRERAWGSNRPVAKHRIRNPRRFGRVGGNTRGSRRRAASRTGFEGALEYREGQ